MMSPENACQNCLLLRNSNFIMARKGIFQGVDVREFDRKENSNAPAFIYFKVKTINELHSNKQSVKSVVNQSLNTR